jgi:lipoyl-dependent peroxiredoxin
MVRDAGLGTLEAAILNVRLGQERQFEEAFRQASHIIASAEGYLSHELYPCVEADCKYLLLVRWRALEDHVVGFRRSVAYQEWKSLLHHFYNPFPIVQHFREVKTGRESGKGENDMPVRTAEAEWKGNLMEGEGRMKLGSGAFDGPFTFKSRMENGPGTNPEELIGAAHAGCFSMALSHQLASAGFTPKRVHTKANVRFEKGDAGFAISQIALETEAEVPGINEAKFLELATAAKNGCPVSKALAGTNITLNARLVSASHA